MLLNVEQRLQRPPVTGFKSSAGLVRLLGFTHICYEGTVLTGEKDVFTPEVVSAAGNSDNRTAALYRFPLPFEITSILLLAGIIGGHPVKKEIIKGGNTELRKRNLTLGNAEERIIIERKYEARNPKQIRMLKEQNPKQQFRTFDI